MGTGKPSPHNGHDFHCISTWRTRQQMRCEMTFADSFVPHVNKMSRVAVKWKTGPTEIENILAMTVTNALKPATAP